MSEVVKCFPAEIQDSEELWVSEIDYDAPAAEVERLRAALEKIKFRTDCFVEDDADMQPHSAEVISDIARAALAGWRES